MVVPSPLALSEALPFDVVSLAPSLVVLVLLTVVVLSVIYAYQPPLPQSMALAFVPWVVAGSLLSVLATGGRYPDYLEPLFGTPGAYLLALFVPGLAWVAILNLSVSRSELPAYHHYLGTMGTGATVVLWSALLLDAGVPPLSRLLVLVVVPLVALLATGAIALTIGFWSPDFIDYAWIVGSFTLFGLLVNGIATTASVAVRGASGHTPFSATVRDVVTALAPGGVAGVDPTHLWVWLFLLANVAIGIHVATSLAPYADRSPRAVNVMLGSVGVLGFALGFNRLLVLVVG
jgi:uncharacterized membrane protein